jgi:hypothetical protein
MAYAGILAHGTSLTAAECARMIPQLSATSIRQAMRWAGDERGWPGLPGGAGVHAGPRHRRHLGPSRSGLLGHDEPGDQPPGLAGPAGPGGRHASIGIYSHVKDRWGIFHAQPIVLNERQAGAAIEGVVRQERVETTQLAVDTHGYTDFAMAWLGCWASICAPGSRSSSSGTCSCRAA